MSYRVEFFNQKVMAEVLGWPAGIAASFAVIALRMVEHGPNLGLPYTRAIGDGLLKFAHEVPRALGVRSSARWWASVSSCCTASSRKHRPRPQLS